MENGAGIWDLPGPKRSRAESSRIRDLEPDLELDLELWKALEIKF
jgi:hypothetical protein